MADGLDPAIEHLNASVAAHAQSIANIDAALQTKADAADVLALAGRVAAAEDHIDQLTSTHLPVVEQKADAVRADFDQHIAQHPTPWPHEDRNLADVITALEEKVNRLCAAIGGGNAAPGSQPGAGGDGGGHAGHAGGGGQAGVPGGATAPGTLTAQVDALRQDMEASTLTLIPIACVSAYAGAVPNANVPLPAGWLLCDGGEPRQVDYPLLWAAIGTAHGVAANPVANFKLPDYRGYFLRGVLGQGTAARDPDSAARAASAHGGTGGNTVGSKQDDSLASHQHANTLTDPGHSHRSWWAHGVGCSGPMAHYERGACNCGPHADGAQTNTVATGVSITNAAAGSLETRPRNKYVNYIIRAK